MSRQHIVTIYNSGLQLWLNEKKSIILRLIVWPNLISLGFIGLVALSILTMHTETTNQQQLNSASNVNFTIYGSEYKKEIASAITNKSVKYNYIATTDKELPEIKEMITAKVFSFALSVKTNKSEQFTLDLIYDKNRGDVHKDWLATVQNKRTDIAKAINQAQLLASAAALKLKQEQELEQLQGQPELKAEAERMALELEQAQAQAILDAKLPTIQLNVLPYAKPNDSMVFNFTVFILWVVLLIAPLESAISITSRQMLLDTEHSFMSTWKAAGVSSYNIILGRFLTSITVYLAGMAALFASLCAWLAGYFALVDSISPYAANYSGENTIMRQTAYMLTDGFNSIINNISVTNMLLCIITATLLASLLIMLRLRLSVYFSNLEQVRTKFVPINVFITSLPVLGFVLGTFSFTLWWVPGLNALTVFQHLFTGGVPATFLLSCWATLLVISLAFYFSASLRVGDQKRLMLNH